MSRAKRTRLKIGGILGKTGMPANSAIQPQRMYSNLCLARKKLKDKVSHECQREKNIDKTDKTHIPGCHGEE